MTTAAIVVSASADAQSPAVFSTTQTSGDLVATGGWSVSPDGGPITVHWLCSTFEHNLISTQEADLGVTLSQQANTGTAVSTIVQGSATTNRGSGQNTASVSATAAGIGLAGFQVTLQLEDQFSPAGTYDATVDVTLTSP